MQQRTVSQCVRDRVCHTHTVTHGAQCGCVLPPLLLLSCCREQATTQQQHPTHPGPPMCVCVCPPPPAPPTCCCRRIHPPPSLPPSPSPSYSPVSLPVPPLSHVACGQPRVVVGYHFPRHRSRAAAGRLINPTPTHTHIHTVTPTSTPVPCSCPLIDSVLPHPPVSWLLLLHRRHCGCLGTHSSPVVKWLKWRCVDDTHARGCCCQHRSRISGGVAAGSRCRDCPIVISCAPLLCWTLESSLRAHPAVRDTRVPAAAPVTSSLPPAHGGARGTHYPAALL